MNVALWLHDGGIRLFPIKWNSKEPNCRSWDDYEATREEVASFRNYGVALGPIGVADTDNPEAEVWAAANLPTTPFMVKTGRGIHRYYKLSAKAPNFFYRAGLTIEFRNQGQYVVGEGSTHVSGAKYTALSWPADWSAMPFFPLDFEWDDRPLSDRGSAVLSGDPFKVPEIIREGARHSEMFRMMRSMQSRGVPLDGAIKACQIENELRCQPPLLKETLAKHLRRVYRHTDRPGFHRYLQSPWDICYGLIAAGFSVEATLVAVRSVKPDFDPMSNPPNDFADDAQVIDASVIDASVIDAQVEAAAEWVNEVNVDTLMIEEVDARVNVDKDSK